MDARCPVASRVAGWVVWDTALHRSSTCKFLWAIHLLYPLSQFARRPQCPSRRDRCLNCRRTAFEGFWKRAP
eukprot:5921513-Amphidinium_carterae.1